MPARNPRANGIRRATASCAANRAEMASQPLRPRRCCFLVSRSSLTSPRRCIPSFERRPTLAQVSRCSRRSPGGCPKLAPKHRGLKSATNRRRKRGLNRGARLPMPRGVYEFARRGHVAEWLRNGLQNRVHQFNSGRGLHQHNQWLDRLLKARESPSAGGVPAFGKRNQRPGRPLSLAARCGG